MSTRTSGGGSGPVLVGRMVCSGAESSLLECAWSAVTCTHAEDVGVQCEGKLR